MLVAVVYYWCSVGLVCLIVVGAGFCISLFMISGFDLLVWMGLCRCAFATVLFALMVDLNCFVLLCFTCFDWLWCDLLIVLFYYLLMLYVFGWC